jgi:16S rRNA (guanine527-N7)-methyltransferase
MLREPSRAPLPLPSPPPLEAPADFRARVEALGVTLEDAQLHTLGDYLARLLAMNEQLNLTAIREPGEAWTRHALDALSLVPHLADLPAGASVLDVGSGGGVPGIPLAIARPDLRVTLLDATAKKVAFLEAVTGALGLANVTTVAGRAEALLLDRAATFDAVTARAVAKLAALLPWTAPFARAGGRVLLIKGERAEQELTEAARVLKKLRCVHERTTVTSTGRVVVLRVG